MLRYAQKTHLSWGGNAFSISYGGLGGRKMAILPKLKGRLHKGHRGISQKGNLFSIGVKILPHIILPQGYTPHHRQCQPLTRVSSGKYLTVRPLPEVAGDLETVYSRHPVVT